MVLAGALNRQKKEGVKRLHRDRGVSEWSTRECTRLRIIIGERGHADGKTLGKTEQEGTRARGLVQGDVTDCHT